MKRIGGVCICAGLILGLITGCAREKGRLREVSIIYTDSCYHLPNCSLLVKNHVQVSQVEAIEMGYIPCEVCKP